MFFINVGLWHLAIRRHRFSEPRFTLVEAAEICRVDYQVLNQWIARELIEVGQKPEGSRRTLYSVADLVTIALIGDLNRVIAMRPGIATAFIDKAQLRVAEVARGGFGGDGRHFLIGWQSGPDTFSVLPLIKIRGIDWAEFEHPVAVIPIDSLIERIIRKSGNEA